MNVFYKLSVAIVITCVALAAQADTLENLQRQWEAINKLPLQKEKFEQLIPRLLEFRQQPGAKGWKLDYLLGSSYCVVGLEESGKTYLYRVLASYGLPDEARTAAEKMIADCGKPSAAIQGPGYTVVFVSGQMGAIVHGKGGYEVTQSAHSSQLHASPVPVFELQKRLFMPDHAAEAVKAALAREGSPSARGVVANSFVITTRGDMPPEYTGECLARYRRPLEAQFGMQFPAALITVYTAGEPEDVRHYAARLHGVDLPLGTVAYSVYEDLSIVGVTAFEACGSLAHELVHLAIHESFGDSPAWLEEGLASEVAVASPEHDVFRFGPSWRDELLRRQWALRPTVSQLLEKVWADYSAKHSSEVDRVAALHAMAATFIRYLDARHKLVPVYSQIRDTLSAPTPRSDREILESQLGMNLDQIDADFVKWFRHVPGIL